MTHDPLLSPKLKLEQADRHINDVADQVRGFFQTGRFIETFLEPDPDGLRQIIKVRALKKLPFRIALTAADAISNMRSALDHLVQCLAIKNGGKIKGAAFPFAGDWKQVLESKTQQKISALSSEARQMILDLQPYPVSETEPDKGGNNKLWAMNKLRNVDIHQMIVPMGMVSVGHSASVSTQSHVGLNVIEAPVRFVFDERMTAEVMRVPGKAEDVSGRLIVRMDVGFGEIFPVAGVPLLMVLTDFREQTSSIVADAEKRFFS
jgi:hypothetical protein